MKRMQEVRAACGKLKHHGLALDEAVYQHPSSFFKDQLQRHLACVVVVVHLRTVEDDHISA